MRYFFLLTEVLFLAVFIFITAMYIPNYDEPVTERQVCEIVETLLRESSPELSIHRVTRGLAYWAEWSMGYYYVELRPYGFMIVPASKRYPIDDARGVKIKVPYPDFFIKIEGKILRPVAYYDNPVICLVSFYDWILGRTPKWNVSVLSDCARLQKILKNEGGILSE